MPPKAGTADLSDQALQALAERAGALLLTASRRVATAESCTGGWVAKCLTDIAGSSQWFERGSAPASGAGGGSGNQTWWEGPESARVEVSEQGNDMLILEGFDQSTVERLRQALLTGGPAQEDANRPASPKSSQPK